MTLRAVRRRPLQPGFHYRSREWSSSSVSASLQLSREALGAWQGAAPAFATNNTEGPTSLSRTQRKNQANLLYDVFHGVFTQRQGERQGDDKTCGQPIGHGEPPGIQ